MHFRDRHNKDDSFLSGQQNTNEALFNVQNGTNLRHRRDLGGTNKQGRLLRTFQRLPTTHIENLLKKFCIHILLDFNGYECLYHPQIGVGNQLCSAGRQCKLLLLLHIASQCKKGPMQGIIGACDFGLWTYIYT